MIGFIGAGAMGGAIIRGVLANGHVAPHDVIITAWDQNQVTALKDELGVRAAASNVDLVAEVGLGGIVVVAVKPDAIPGVLNEIAQIAQTNETVIVSIAAGTPIEKLAAPLADDQPIVRVMPNVAAQIGKGMSAITTNGKVADYQIAEVAEVFNAVGLTTQIAEKDFAAFSAIASCSPAWTFTYIDALARGALAAGIPKAEAVRIAAQAVMGSAQLVLDSAGKANPEALVDSVTSPGGTTIAGLIAMEEAGFSTSVVAGVRGAIARDNEIASR